MPATTLDTNKDLQALVRELSKANPDVNLLKNKTNILGISYSPDLIILMSEVLVYLSKSKQPKSRLKEKIV